MESLLAEGQSMNKIFKYILIILLCYTATAIPIRHIFPEEDIKRYKAPGAFSQEETEDIIGAMVSGNIEIKIDVTYDDPNSKLDFIVDANGILAVYDHNVFLRVDGSFPLGGPWDTNSHALTNVNIDTGDIATAVTNTEWDAAFTHISATGSSHTFIDQAVLTTSDVVHNELTTTGKAAFGQAIQADAFVDILTPKIALNVVGTQTGLDILSRAQNTANSSNILYGTKTVAQAFGNFNYGSIYGLWTEVQTWGTGSYGSLYGTVPKITMFSAGSAANIYGFSPQIGVRAGTVTNAFVLYAFPMSVTTGSLANAYSFYDAGQTIGVTSNWSYYNAGGADSYMGLDGATVMFGTTNTDLQISSDGTNGIIDVATSLRLGNITTNYTQIADDGELTLAGDARVMRSMDLEPVLATRPSANPPGEGTEDSFATHDFNPTTEESVFFHLEIPHYYADAGIIHIHFDFFVDTAPASAQSVVWGVEYKKQSIGDNFDFDAGTTISYTQTSITTGTPANDKKVHQSAEVSLVTTGFVGGDYILLRLFRDADGTGGTDDFTSDARVIDYHIELLSDKLGEPL